MVFPVCESWSIKKAELQITDTFKLWCWRRFLRDPRESNQSIPKEINPECSLEGLFLKLQYFGHLLWRADSLEKTLMLGKIEGKGRRRRQRMRWLDSITDSRGQIPGDSRGQGSLAGYSPCSCKESDPFSCPTLCPFQVTAIVSVSMCFFSTRIYWLAA